MARALFEVDLAGGLATRLYRQGSVDVDAFPWGSIDVTGHDPGLVERARGTWTENAFNEFCTGAALGQLVHEMALANVPLDLWGIAARFPSQELLHVELCGRMAMDLGGGAPLVYDTDDLIMELDPDLTPLQRVSEMIVRICCVGEVFSLPMLTGAMRASHHPLTRAVLEQIVRDEAMHGKLGWLYLDWIDDHLTVVERDRLSIAAAETAEHMSEFWERLRSAGALTEEERVSFGVMGWMKPDAYVQLAMATMEQEVFERLRSYGIRAA